MRTDAYRAGDGSESEGSEAAGADVAGAGLQHYVLCCVHLQRTRR